MATATFTVRVRDDLGNETVGTATVQLVSAPVIIGIVASPTSVGAGGTVDLQVNALSPDGRPLTFVPSVSQGTVVASGAPGHFTWTL